MDLLVPCIVEGRSELRNVGRVNCKTHWPFHWAAEHLTYWTFKSLSRLICRIRTQTAARSVESALHYSNHLTVNLLYTFFSQLTNYTLYENCHDYLHVISVAPFAHVVTSILSRMLVLSYARIRPVTIGRYLIRSFITNERIADFSHLIGESMLHCCVYNLTRAELLRYLIRN